MKLAKEIARHGAEGGDQTKEPGQAQEHRKNRCRQDGGTETAPGLGGTEQGSTIAEDAPAVERSPEAMPEKQAGQDRNAVRPHHQRQQL